QGLGRGTESADGLDRQRVMAPILETRALCRDFGALRAVADVDFAVEQGELRAIIGPNGAGKTSFFHLISGVIRPTGGQVFFRSGPRCSSSMSRPRGSRRRTRRPPSPSSGRSPGNAR